MGRRFLGLAAAAISAALLCGCRGADIAVSAGGPGLPETTDAPITDSGITLRTEPERSDTTEPAEEVSEVYIPETEPAAEQFELPAEFYEKMNGILEKYSLNIGCDGTEECSCRPEYEEYDADGNVTVPRSGTVSVYFLDINSGFEYELNPGAHYPIASTVKIPFCTMIYQKIDEGIIDPEQVLTYEERHYFGGSGVIVEGDFGQQFTVRELLQLAITRSDNIAYEMLKDILPWEEFSEYLTLNGCTHEQDVRLSKQKICCESAGAYGRILADYLTGGGQSVELFKEDLQNTRVPMIVSDYPVYRKYGWAGFSFHDIAYVDAPRPYVLAILTNFTGEGASDYKFFAEVTALLEEYCEPEGVDEG